MRSSLTSKYMDRLNRVQIEIIDNKTMGQASQLIVFLVFLNKAIYIVFIKKVLYAINQQTRYDLQENIDYFRVFCHFVQNDFILYQNLVQMLTNKATKIVDTLGFIAITLGYIWLWTFNLNPHNMIKFLTMQCYFLSWLYFLLRILNKKSILGLSIAQFFQFNLVFQMIITPSYWLLIHGWIVSFLKLPPYELGWNIYTHVIPLTMLIIEFCFTRVEIGNHWKHSLGFLIIFALPVNYLYTTTQGPVYYFLTYQTRIDILILIIGGCLCVGAHMLTSVIFRKLAFKKIKQE